MCLGCSIWRLGEALPLAGSFDNIPWESANQFVKVEVDIAGGSNYTAHWNQ
jgi:hypothetical protein